MKRAIKREFNIRQPYLKVELNKSSNSCAPCFNEALAISKKEDGRSIKKIVSSVFENKSIK